MAHATDIVGYTYRADVYCPRCIVGKLIANFSDIAEYRGINRMDESTFDSGEFPKVVFRDMLVADDGDWADGEPNTDRCGSCGEVLGEETAS